MVRISTIVANVLASLATIVPGMILVALVWDQLRPFVEARLEPFGHNALVAAFVVLAYVGGVLADGAGSLLDRSLPAGRGGRERLLNNRVSLIAAAREAGFTREVEQAMSLDDWVMSSVDLNGSTAAANIKRLRTKASFLRTLIPVLLVAAVTGLVDEKNGQLVAAAALAPVVAGAYVQVRTEVRVATRSHYVLQRTSSSQQGK